MADIGSDIQQNFTPTTEGTPQGDIISSTLANGTLYGMEKIVEEKIPQTYGKQENIQSKSEPDTICRRLCRNRSKQVNTGRN